MQPLPGQLSLFDTGQDLAQTTGGILAETTVSDLALTTGCQRAAWWLAFTADHDPAAARAAFRRRYRCDPEEIRPGLGGLLLAGPVPGEVQP